MTKIKRVVVVAAAVAATPVAVAALSACSQQQLASVVTGKLAYHPAYWVIEGDTSGSTERQGVRGGVYEHEIMAALAQAAHQQATVFAGAIDGNAIGDAAWQIDGVRLTASRDGGNAKLAEGARQRRADGLRGQVRRLLATRPTNGSDILGALQQVVHLTHSLPRGAPRTLVLLTDGAINLSKFGGYDVYTQPPDTRAVRQALIARFEREGELPQLAGWRVYLGGIGVGIGDRRTARAVVALWEELIAAAGAEVVQAGPTLAFS
ncbi:MAG TPA: hypothetical protein VL979_08155 [Solirubrobacteraceae bacterium]|nr:hypothetical protein [Solirubrobacteraceae bacterium]